MILGIPRETCDGERRVSMTPLHLGALAKAGIEVVIESGAGEAAGFPDDDYTAHGGRIKASRAEVFAQAQIIAQVRTYGANPGKGAADLELMRSGQVLIGHAEPLLAHSQTRTVAERGATLLAVELIPRITRAQAMDVLSSQANLAGYRAVLSGAVHLGRILPMMMTAAGTLKPAKVFIIGAGVAGLQAIATAKRLGALVSAIDVRPEVKEQVESLGARFVQPPETAASEDGYAREQTAEQNLLQQTSMADTLAESDLVITTASIPGRKAPTLVTAAMVKRMRPGSVVVDLAAERGGNCELTVIDSVITREGVVIDGTANVPALVPTDASSMYAGNITRLLDHLVKQGELTLDVTDEITAGMMVTRGGQIVHPRVRDLMSLEPLKEPEPTERSGS